MREAHILLLQEEVDRMSKEKTAGELHSVECKISNFCISHHW